MQWSTGVATAVAAACLLTTVRGTSENTADQLLAHSGSPNRWQYGAATSAPAVRGTLVGAHYFGGWFRGDYSHWRWSPEHGGGPNNASADWRPLYPERMQVSHCTELRLLLWHFCAFTPSGEQFLCLGSVEAAHGFPPPHVTPYNPLTPLVCRNVDHCWETILRIGRRLLRRSQLLTEHWTFLTSSGTRDGLQYLPPPPKPPVLGYLCSCLERYCVFVELMKLYCLPPLACHSDLLPLSL